MTTAPVSGFGNILIPLPQSVPVEVYAKLPRHNFIDGHVWDKLQQLGITPSEPCGDATFQRRAYLDVIGRLPSPAETKAFLADASADKRGKLIDHLLERPEYADHWAVKWGDLIRPNPARVGVKPVYLLDLWLRESFRQNKPYDRFVREQLAGDEFYPGSDEAMIATGYLRLGMDNNIKDERTRMDELDDLVATTSLSFLGINRGP